MDFKLTNQLLDAHFPSREPFFLEAVFSALGQNLYGVERVNNYQEDGIIRGDGWIAIPYPVDYSEAVFGETVEESLAKLWLKLHT